jgi:6,7-dimethyl-8-ribityllumazine synthase
MASLKGIRDTQSYDGVSHEWNAPALINLSFGVVGSDLRIAIVHARWNSSVVDRLVDGAKKSLLALGVRKENLVIQSVPGCWELPFAVHRYVNCVFGRRVGEYLTPPWRMPMVTMRKGVCLADGSTLKLIP